MIRTIAIGNLVSDPKRFTYNGDNVGINFTLACNKGGRFSNGQTSFLRCTYYNVSDNFLNYFEIGSQYIVEGDLIIEPYDANNQYSGQATLIIDRLEFGRKKQ